MHPGACGFLSSLGQLTMAGKMTDLDIKQSEKGDNRIVRFETGCGQSGRGVADAGLDDEIEALIPRLTRYARALTRDAVAAEDLVQESLGRALGKIHQWEKGTDLRAWLFTILHNQHVSRVRQEARERAVIELQKCSPRLMREQQQITRLEVRDLQRAIAELSEEQRSAILFVGLEGMRYDHAAAVLNLPLGTVRSRVARARETLRIRTGLFPSRQSRRPTRAENLDCLSRETSHLTVNGSA
jgi:RNA polymerase sigma-70 factor (ECF subfamily)